MLVFKTKIHRLEWFVPGEPHQRNPSENMWFLRDFMTWKVMPRNVWNDIVSWRTKHLNNSTKSQLRVLTTTLQRKNWNLGKNYQKYAHKLYWNAYTWHVLEDLIFYGQWTIVHDQSQNGRKYVTNVWINWFLTFIIHMNTNNIVMWLILQNNAGWHCFKTQIWQEIFRIQNLHQMEHCAFS